MAVSGYQSRHCCNVKRNALATGLKATGVQLACCRHRRIIASRQTILFSIMAMRSCSAAQPQEQANRFRLGVMTHTNLVRQFQRKAIGTNKARGGRLGQVNI
jgi:hypothetical protein